MATEPSAQPSLDALPTAPSRGDAPSVFRTRADAFVAALVSFRTQLVAVADWITSTAQEVYDNAVEAATSATTATTKAGEASTSATNAAASETQAGLYASAAAGSAEIDVSSNDFGDFFQVVDVGSGTKGLAISPQRREKTGTLTGTTPALNQTNGIVLEWTLTGNSTPTDDLEDGESLILYIDDGTGYSITWPTATWTNNDGAAPTLKASGNTVIVANKVGTDLYLTVVEAG